MTSTPHPLKHLLTGVIRVLTRRIWGSLCRVGLRWQVWVWGAPAFERAVFHAPPWLALIYLQAWGAVIGPEIDFHGRLTLHGAYQPQGKLTIGARCHLGPGVTLDLTGPIVLGEGCTVSLNTQILTHQDVGYSPLGHRLYPTTIAGVSIDAGAYIGAGAILFPGVQIGRCAVIGAGSVVRESVPAFTVVAGVPARVIKQLDPTAVED
jgi:maltose O-acetyltransferase